MRSSPPAAAPSPCCTGPARLRTAIALSTLRWTSSPGAAVALGELADDDLVCRNPRLSPQNSGNPTTSAANAKGANHQ